MIGLLAAAAVALSGANGKLQGILTALSDGGDTLHAGTIVSALAASPELVCQYDALAASFMLKGMVLTTTPVGRLGASHREGVISITSTFIENQTPASGDHIQALGNLVFILGYEAAKVRSAPEIAAAESQGLDHFKALMASTPKGGSPDVTALVQESMRLHIEDEARAYLQGWNDEVDAAITAKGGPLTPAEAFRMLREGRNTKPLLGAALLSEDQRIVPEPTFRFPPNARNLKAVISVLGRSNLPDFM